jgi:NADH-ubiquinone oxidoreductase chain 5
MHLKQIIYTHEAPMIIVIPLVILSIISIGFGYVAKDAFVGVGTDFLSTALFQHPDHISLIEAEFGLPLLLKLLPAIGSFFRTGLALYLYHAAPLFTIHLTDSALGKTVYAFLNGKWLIDNVYNGYIITGGLKLGHTISKVIDRGIVELVGPFGLSNVLTNTSRNIASYDTGIITSYALYIILGLISFLFLLFTPILLGSSLESVFGGDIGLILVYLSALVLLPSSVSKSNT